MDSNIKERFRLLVPTLVSVAFAIGVLWFFGFPVNIQAWLYFMAGISLPIFFAYRPAWKKGAALVVLALLTIHICTWGYWSNDVDARNGMVAVYHGDRGYGIQLCFAQLGNAPIV